MAALRQAETSTLDVQQGAVGAVRADSVVIDRGALGGAMSGTVDVQRSIARSLVARQATIRQAIVRQVVAAEVRAEQGSIIGIALAPRISGQARILLDWRGGLAFGAAFGLVLGLLRRRGGASKDDRG